MAFNLRKYENQAKLSVSLAIFSVVCAIGAIGLLLRNFEPADRFTYYSPRSLWFPAMLGMLFFALATGAIGFLVGLLSAGQRRNQAVGTSWAGFFLSAASITVALCAGLFFYFTRNSIAAG